MHALHHRRSHLFHHVVRVDYLKVFFDVFFGGGRVRIACLGYTIPAKN
jgi:hypothetical protein